jgi:hypothetical protein
MFAVFSSILKVMRAFALFLLSECMPYTLSYLPSSGLISGKLVGQVVFPSFWGLVAFW